MHLSSTTATVVLDAVDFGVHVQLVRPDTSEDGSRFCHVLWQPGLWDEGALVEVCGRSGQPGTMHLTRHPTRAHAQPQVVQVLLRLVRAGYHVMNWE